MTQKKSLKEKLVAVHEAHVEEEMAALNEERTANQIESLLVVLGGIRAVHSVSEALSTQSIRGLQRIREEQLYKVTGFNRFDDFLDQSPLSPMNYKKFNRLETALLNEGDELFNYLNAINAPMAKRRLLGKGTLSVEGEEIVIRQDDEEEQRIPVSNRAVLLTTLSKLADQHSEQRRTIERQKATIKRVETENENLQRKIVAAENSHSNTIVSKGFDDCLFASISTLSQLAGRIADLEPAEAEAIRYRVLELVSGPYQKLQEAFLVHQGKPIRRVARGSSSLTANVTQADLESLMETLET